MFPGRFRLGRYRASEADLPGRPATNLDESRLETGMSSDPNATVAPAAWTCANCEARFSWAPVAFLGLSFCCSGCAASGPCTCTYEDVPQRAQSGFGAAGALPEPGPRPSVLMTAEIRERLAREVEVLSAIVAGRVSRRRARFVAEGDGAGSVASGGTAVAAAAATAAADRGLAGRVGRLMVLEDLLARARVPELDGRAVVGSRVKVYDGGDRIATYTIVLPADADPHAGRIAPDSPLARVLMGARAGDTLTVQIAGAERPILVVDVRYPVGAAAAAPAARGPRRTTAKERVAVRR